MTEFLTENSRRAYPLAGDWPSSMYEWRKVLLDVSVGHTAEEPDSYVPKLLSVVRVTSGSTSSCVFRFGSGTDTPVSVSVAAGSGETVTKYASGGNYKAFVTVSGRSLDALLPSLPTTAVSLNIPLDMRCVSGSNRRVTSVASYSPAAAYVCKRPLFASSETPVGTITGGDITLAAEDGIDIESTTMLPVYGNIIRISALSAPAESSKADEYVDLMIRGDDCFTVETLPGSKVVGGAVVKRTAADTGGVLRGGVIKIGTKCKPCCQCEDYKAAFDAVSPSNDAVSGVEDILDEAKGLYEEAVEAFESLKSGAVAAINDYVNVHVSSAGVGSGGVSTGATATGYRKRIAVTTSVANMTMKNVTVRAVASSLFTIPGFSKAISLAWHTGGTSPRYGTSLPSSTPMWTLKPGDTLAIVGTYAASASTNEASVPSGATSTVFVAIAGKTEKQKTVNVR